MQADGVSCLLFACRQHMPISRAVADDLPAAGDRHDASRSSGSSTIRCGSSSRLHCWCCSSYLVIFSSAPVPTRCRPRPATTRLIEMVWTVGPVVILLFPRRSFVPAPDRAAIRRRKKPSDRQGDGNQWYWDYEYEAGETMLSFDSAPEGPDRAAAGKEDKAYPRLLAVDNELVVPVNTRRSRSGHRGADVIHAFAMPSFGVKIDAVPGRSNETWFKAERKACTTASVRSSAARTTRSCRSPSAWFPRTSTSSGWLLPPPICPAQQDTHG
jgi:hypothetical protein